MRRRIFLGIPAIVAIIILVVILFQSKLGIDMAQYITGIAVALTVAVLGIGYWTFKPKIDKYIESISKKTGNVTQIQEAIPSPELNIIFGENGDTYTPSRSYRTHVIGETIYKKFMRVKIENRGNAIAKRCDARLQVLTDNRDGTNPSTDSKPLPWDSGDFNTYIGINNDAMLDMGFSNSRVVVDSKDNSLRKVAFISTWESKNPTNIYYPRIEDGFNIGDYEVKLTIRDESGASAEAVFRLHITEDWDKISMKRIQSS